MKGEDYLENVRVDGRIISKIILRELDEHRDQDNAQRRMYYAHKRP